LFCFSVCFYFIRPVASKPLRYIGNSNKAIKSKKYCYDFVGDTFEFVKISSLYSTVHQIVCYYKNIKNVFHYSTFLISKNTELIQLLKSIVIKHVIRYNIKFGVTYDIPSNETSSENKAFKTSARKIIIHKDFEKILEKYVSTLLTEEYEYQGKAMVTIFRIFMDCC